MKQLIALIMFSSAFASADCYDLSRNGQTWNEADLLCVDDPNADTSVFTLSLMDPNGQKTVEIFSSTLLMRAKCLCNHDTFGTIPDIKYGFGMRYEAPSQEAEDGMKIDVEFHEATERSIFKKGHVREAGTVDIRDMTFHYRAHLFTPPTVVEYAGEDDEVGL